MLSPTASAPGGVAAESQPLLRETALARIGFPCPRFSGTSAEFTLSAVEVLRTGVGAASAGGLGSTEVIGKGLVWLSNRQPSTRPFCVAHEKVDTFGSQT